MPPTDPLAALLPDDNSDDWLERLREAEDRPPLGTAGPFELLEEVSRGGQGVVFRARRARDGHGRVAGEQVALKRLIAGAFASTPTRLRFEREVEAASALDHPNIVRIYGMETIDGQPIIAMEWIDGVPINEWASRRRAAGRGAESAILETLLAVTGALVHAHQKGVIHRDIKPSNILVDRTGHARLVDFGLAKWTPAAKAEAGHATLTHSSHFLGTPAYAAPEQLRGDADQVDVRADVYALGVICYELLTGELPHPYDGKLSRFLERVESNSPQRPSNHNRALDRDVDVLVLKALAVEPERRYQSADAMADDLRRNLTGQPVQAHAPSGLYRARKLLLRNRWPFALGATIVAFTILFAVRAAREAEDERAARVAVERERDLARTAARKAEAIQSFLIEDVLAAADQAARREETTIREVLDAASKKLPAAFPNDPLVSAALHATVGEVYLSLGLELRAKPHFEAAIESRQDRVAASDAELNRARSGLGLVAFYEQDFERARELLASARLHQESAGDDPVGLARTLDRTARLHQRLDADLVRAEVLLRQALELERGALGSEARLLSRTMGRLTNVLTHLGKYAEAKKLALELLERDTAALGTDHIAIAAALRELGRVQMMDGSWNDAVATYTRGIEVYERLEPTSGIGSLRLELYTELARVQMQLRHVDAARTHFEVARVGYEAAGAPAAVRLGHLYYYMSQLEDIAGRSQASEGLLTQAISTLTGVYGASHYDVVTMGQDLAMKFAFAQRYEEAEAMLTAAAEAHRGMHGSDHMLTATVLGNLGVVASLRGDFAKAAAHLEEAHRMTVRLFPDGHPESCARLENLAHACTQLGRAPEAEAYAREGLDLALALLGPDSDRTARLRLIVGQCLLRRGDLEPAEQELRLALSSLEVRPGELPNTVNDAALSLALCLHRRGGFDEAEGLLLRYFELLRGAGDAVQPAALPFVDALASLLETVERAEESAEWRELAAAARSTR